MLTRSSRSHQAPPSALPDQINPPHAASEAAHPSADAGWFSSDNRLVMDAAWVLASIARQTPQGAGAPANNTAPGVVAPTAHDLAAPPHAHGPAAQNFSVAAPHDFAGAVAHVWTPLHQAAEQGDLGQVELLFAEARRQIVARLTGSLGLNQSEWEAIGRFAEESAHLGGVLGNSARHESPTGRIEHGPSPYWFQSANYLSIKLQALRAAVDAFAPQPVNLSRVAFANWQNFEQSLADYLETWAQVRENPFQASVLPLSQEALQRHADALVAHGVAVPLVNQPDAYGNTPLHVAVACEQWAVAQRLMRYGADFDQPNHAGITPRDRSAQVQPHYHDQTTQQEHSAGMAKLEQIQNQLANLLARLNRP